MHTSQTILDTNYYISYFTKRDLEQFSSAQKHLQNMVKTQISVYLPDLIVAEIVYILEDFYQFKRSVISQSILSLVVEKKLLMEDKELIILALDLFEKHKLDFADCYLVAFAKLHQTQLFTFDKKLLKIL
jgi:predicted nucleic-acid-binding protein